jgi:quinol-cytochrome oxidoreductase complex cytochrome b subunit
MSFLNYVDERLRFSSRHRRLMDKQAPVRLNYFFCLGGMTFTLFILELITGLLLSVHYIPSETDAYQSIQRLHTSILLGGLLRSVHHWTANLMVVMIILHMVRVFVTGSYKNPRELNWIAGVVLFVLTLGFGFSGYLLPWDQKAYWATVVGTNMIGSVPFIGQALAGLVRGGAEVNGQTLLRFYSMHVLWFPLLTGLFLWVHFHILRRVGISGGM